MSEANPYRPPAARVEDVVRPATDSGEFIDGGQALSAGRGWGWIAGGFRMFKSKPATWILITIVLGVIFISAVIDLIVGSASAKWALLSPILVPMSMSLGVAPELTQAAYRIGDSCVNIVTPMMPYFPLVVVFCRRYVKSSGIGTVVSMMLPYSIVFLLVGLQIDFGSLVAAAPAIAWGLLALTLGRAAAVYPFVSVLWLRGTRIPLAWQHLMVWGNLKGSLSMALALSLPEWLPERPLLRAVVFGCALVTLTLQGLTLAPVAQLLGVAGSGEARRRTTPALARRTTRGGGKWQRRTRASRS